MSKIHENLDILEKRIQDACDKCGRKREEVLLIGVTKTRTADEVNEAVSWGITDVGENKVQEIMDKYDHVPGNVKWHMIGHLQTNKVKYIIDKACLIHSVDSLRLAETISQEAVKKNVTASILIEVNVAGEESKFGVAPNDTEELIEKISHLSNIQVKGLMTIAPFVENAEENREIFRNLRNLSVDIQEKKFNNVTMNVLSMGMTGDYEVAIEEGATMVRVGTGIFGERDYSK